MLLSVFLDVYNRGLRGKKIYVAMFLRRKKKFSNVKLHLNHFLILRRSCSILQSGFRVTISKYI